MQFRTEIDFKTKREISYSDNLMFFGSCFSENIGNYFTELKFRTDTNPFGILFNPSSIAKAIRRLQNGQPYTENDLFFHDNLWSSYDHHSIFSDTDKNICLQKINKRLTESSAFLQRTNILFITFGTAWIFRKKEDGEIVSNCHKMPENTFVREKLSIDEIVEEYTKLINLLRQKNPDLRIIFTVSPVRHKNNGLHGNQLSKATLLLAIDELQNKFDFVEYFPSYEIMMDDLRDYRFYDEDLAHPNSIAIKYIQEKIGGYFSPKTLALIHEVEEINQAEKHRPFNPESEEYKTFKAKFESQKEQLLKRLYADH